MKPVHADGAAQKIWRMMCVVLAAAFLGIVFPPLAHATVGLAPGIELDIGEHRCSLGFLATNASGDRLAVTAGHCADDTEQKVYSASGDLIGIVAHHTPDDFTTNTWGVTLIALADNTYTDDAKFSSFGDPAVGDYVTKYGFRTDRTEGTIAAVNTDAKQPWNGTMTSTLVGLPGDSGAAWIGVQDGALKLLGLNIGYTTRPDGGYGMATGFPIRALVALVNRNSPAFGRGFIPVGR